MLAKDIAATPEEGSWTEVKSQATLYIHAASRIKVVVEEYRPSNGGIFIDDNEDMEATDKDFIDTFMNSIGMELSAAKEIQLVQALVKNLKEWSKNSQENKEFVNKILTELIKD